VVFLWSAYSVFILNNTIIYAENGPLENLQAILLAISCIVFLAPIAQKRGMAKLIFLFCFLLCCSFILRELDVERLDVPSALKVIGSGIGRNIILTVAFITLFVYAAFKFSYYKKASILFLGSKSGILLMLGGLLLIIGNLFDKSHSIIHNAFIEESFELGGYCFILLSAVASNFGIFIQPLDSNFNVFYRKVISEDILA
jgi:hypothetical protein